MLNVGRPGSVVALAVSVAASAIGADVLPLAGADHYGGAVERMSGPISVVDAANNGIEVFRAPSGIRWRFGPRP